MEEQKKVLMAGIIFVLLIVVGLAIYYFVFYQKPDKAKDVTEVSQEQALAEERVKPEEEEIEPLQIDLDKSDGLMRERVGELSSHPKLALWLMSNDLIRKLVAAVDNIANGQSPRAQIDFFKPEGDFIVAEEIGEHFIDPETYKRYDLASEVFISLDTKGCVTLYKQITPALQQAYRDLGYPSGDFHTTLKKAILELLKVPVVEEKIQVEKKVITYTMVDSKLESLSQAQKHLLRMGPENLRRIQAKLKEIAQALGFQE
jgi:hypothetical protein